MVEPVFRVSDDFARTIKELHKQAGAQWLNQLPTLLADTSGGGGLFVRLFYSLYNFFYFPASCETWEDYLSEYGYLEYHFR